MSIDQSTFAKMQAAVLLPPVRDKEGIERLRTRMREAREALRLKIGIVDLAVPLIRELRDK